MSENSSSNNNGDGGGGDGDYFPAITIKSSPSVPLSVVEAQRVLAYDVEAQRTTPCNAEEIAATDHARALTLSSASAGESCAATFSASFRSPRSRSASSFRSVEHHGWTVHRKQELRALFQVKINDSSSASRLDASCARAERALQLALRVKAEIAEYLEALNTRRDARLEAAEAVARNATLKQDDDDGSDWYFDLPLLPLSLKNSSDDDDGSDSLAYSEDGSDGLLDVTVDDVDYGLEDGSNGGGGAEPDRQSALPSSRPWWKKIFLLSVGMLGLVALAVPCVFFGATTTTQIQDDVVSHRCTQIALRVSDSPKQLALIPSHKIRQATPHFPSATGCSAIVWGVIVPRHTALAVRPSDSDKQLRPISSSSSQTSNKQQASCADCLFIIETTISSFYFNFALDATIDSIIETPGTHFAITVSVHRVGSPPLGLVAVGSVSNS
jgi:hypothetical protein